MLQTFIKEWLLQKKPKAYSIIADTYRKELLSLKPVLFRSWLSKELDVAEEAININSLYSALTRLRKKEASQNKKANNKHHFQNTSSISGNNPDASKQQGCAGDFIFSSPSSADNKGKRVKEY